MPTTIDSTGMLRDRLDVIVANIEAAAKGIFGDDIDLDPSSLDAQAIGSAAEGVNDNTELLEMVYLSRSISGATGAALSRLVQLIGISRNGASYSTADVVHTGTPGTPIPDGSFIDTATTPAANFRTVGDVTIDGTGTAVGTVRATTTGPVFGAAGAISVIKTVISGWASVTNAAAVNLGSDQELDSALRARHRASVAINSKSVVDGIYAALANIQGVSDAAVFENKTGASVIQAGGGILPPNSIQCVVRGGLDADIGAAIWAKASAGVTLVGATSIAVVDSQGVTQSVKFDRPTAAGVFYDIYLRKFPGQQISAATIAVAKQALADYGNSTSAVGSAILYGPLFGAVIGGLAGLSSSPSVAGVAIGFYRGLMSPAAADLAVPYNTYPTWDTSNARVYIYESDGTQGAGFGPY